MNQKTLKKIIHKLKTGLEPVESFDELDAGIKQLTKKLHKKVEAKSLDNVNSTLESFRKDIDLSPIKSALDKLKSETGGIYTELGKHLESRAVELTTRAENALRTLESIQNDNESVREEISSIRGDSKNKDTILKTLSSKQEKSATEFSSLSSDLNKLIKELDSKISVVGKGTGEAESGIINLRKEFEKLRVELLTLVGGIGGGGNMNRQIKVDGVDVLKKYTDINLVAGSGVTLTTAVDETDKNVDITISAGAVAGATLADVSTNSDDTAKSLYTMTAGVPVEFESSDNNTLLYLDETNERIGVGTDTPGTLFTVMGPTQSSAIGSGPVLITATGGPGAVEIGIDTGGSPFLQGFRTDTSVARSLLLQPYGGNVGIGGTPSVKLHVISTGALLPRIESSDGAGDAGWRFYSSTTYKGQVGWDQGTDVMGVYGSGNSATPAIAIDASDRVGLGTTAPTNSLSFGNASSRKIWIENTATDVSGRSLTLSGGGTVAGTSVSDVAGGSMIIQAGLGTGTGASTIFFQNGTTLTTGTTLQTMTTKMVILGNGNVGMGTTAPADRLDLGTGTSGRGITWGSSAVVRYSNIWSAFSSASLWLGAGLMGDTTADQVLYSTNIASGRAAIQMQIFGTSGFRGNIKFYTDPNVTPGAFGDVVTPTERMVITNTGLIGIGISAPTARIHAIGSSIGIRLADSSTDATTKQSRIALDHYTNAEEPLGLIYGVSNSTDNTVIIGGGSSVLNTATSISFYTAANNTTTTGSVRMTIDSSGNVGIGLASGLTNKFTVFGNADNLTTGTIQARNTNDGTSAGATFSVSSGATAAASGYLGAFNGNYTGISAFADRVVLAVNSDASGITLYAPGASQDLRFFAGSTTERMRLDNSGNLGIGVTSVTAYLHIKAGTATASTAPLKFTAGTNLTAAEAGAVEWDGTNLFITQTTGPTRKTIAYTTDIPAAGANTALSNLASVAINTSLISDTNSTDSIGSTGVRWLKGWFDDMETTNMPTVGGTSLASTFAPIASPTFTGTVVLPTTTAGGVITLSENSSIALDPAGSADGKYTGITIAGTAGATLAFGDLVYLAAADSRWELADADSDTTSDRMMGMCVLAAASDGDPTVILLVGQIRADAAFPALTIGSPVYVGETAGDIQVAIPTGADNVIRRVGYALTADEIYFNPSMDSQTTVA